MHNYDRLLLEICFIDPSLHSLQKKSSAIVIYRSIITYHKGWREALQSVCLSVYSVRAVFSRTESFRTFNVGRPIVNTADLTGIAELMLKGQKSRQCGYVTLPVTYRLVSDE